MEEQKVDAQIVLPEPSWENVRSIYQKLSDEFNVLTDAYHLEVDATTKNYLDHLIVTIDDVDQSIDDLPQKEERDAITSSLLYYLGGDQAEWNYQAAPSSLLKKVENLKFIVRAKSIQREFILASKEIFDLTELKRHTLQIDELLAYIKQEGRATARLPLSFLGVKKEEKFGVFFTRLCMLMGIADLIFDAAQDYKNGLIKVEPSLTLYLRLISILTTEGFKLFFSFPNKISLLVYCFKFAKELMKE